MESLFSEEKRIKLLAQFDSQDIFNEYERLIANEANLDETKMLRLKQLYTLSGDDEDFKEILRRAKERALYKDKPDFFAKVGDQFKTDNISLKIVSVDGDKFVIEYIDHPRKDKIKTQVPALARELRKWDKVEIS